LLGAADVVDLLTKNIQDIETKLKGLAAVGSSGVKGGIEKVSSDRVAQAKSRLEAFRSAEKK